MDQWLNGDDVARVLDRVVLPEKIRVDNGSDFTSKRIDLWAYLNGVRLDFSWPGKPTKDDGLIEAFNGLLRAKCLNEDWFRSLADGTRQGKDDTDPSLLPCAYAMPEYAGDHTSPPIAGMLLGVPETVSGCYAEQCGYCWAPADK